MTNFQTNNIPWLTSACTTQVLMICNNNCKHQRLYDAPLENQEHQKLPLSVENHCSVRVSQRQKMAG